MKSDWRNNQLPPSEGSEDRPDGFISIAILAFAIVAPLIYFGPQLGAVEAWIIDLYRTVDSWVAPIRSVKKSVGSNGEDKPTAPACDDRRMDFKPWMPSCRLDRG